tara:strand:+ start:6657 stop:7487 length:831 start_codon:yes stop_codon:yes gene_type:complete
MSNDNGHKKFTKHASPDADGSSKPELLYDRNVAKPSHAEYARTLAMKTNIATLCTMSTKSAGYPYGSYVTYAMHEGDPIFLFSQLAEHTKNLNQNSKASLLIAETGDGNPLALGRVTLVGECHEITGEEREPAKKAFLEAHESASVYADWDDFAFFRLSVDSVRYIGGFGRMSWVSGSRWGDAEADPVDEFSEDIITHMNEDHADALVLYCKAMSKAIDTSEAVMTAIDRYGFEMMATTESGKKPIRLAFSNDVKNSDEARVELVKLVKQARSILK